MTSLQHVPAHDPSAAAEQCEAARDEEGRRPRWRRGPGRPRRLSRTVAAGAAAGAVAALVLGATTVPDLLQGRSASSAPPGHLHLPARVNTPGTWSGAEDPAGPWAAVGLATRTRPAGLTGQRQRLQLFAVSAVDGRSAWVDLPGVDVEDLGLVGWFALSPDGRWLAWTRQTSPPHRRPALAGWSVMETTTGRVRDLADPDHPRLRAPEADLAFSGDSRYLLTSYATPAAPRHRGHRFVAWDVRDGARTVLEPPGHYWLPDPGSAPTGVVWTRGDTVHRTDPATADGAAYPLTGQVVAASWAPDDRAFAFLARPTVDKGDWRLYAGRSLDEARRHPIPLDVDPGQLLGWRDERHVVVGHFRQRVDVVDVVTGADVEVDLAGAGEPLNAPLLAADLWRNPLGPVVAQDGTTDPRRPYRWAGGVLLVVLAGAAVARRRRSPAG